MPTNPTQTAPSFLQVYPQARRDRMKHSFLRQINQCVDWRSIRTLLGKTGSGEQSATVDENGRHDHGLQNRYSCMVRLPHIDRKSRGDKQQDKGHEESGLWF